VGVALLLLALLFAGLAITFGVLYRWQGGGELIVWAAVVALAALLSAVLTWSPSESEAGATLHWFAIGVVLRTFRVAMGPVGRLLAVPFGAALSGVSRWRPGESGEGGPIQVRFALLIFGALAGLATSVLGFVLCLWRYRDIFTSPLKEWAQHPAQVWGVAAALFGGLAILFAGVMLARVVERSNQAMRVLLYGYNAFVGSFLLLAVLLLFNVLVHAPVWPFTLFQKEFDWTEKGIYTLAQSSENELAGLKKPVRVYGLLANDDPLAAEVNTLMDNCRAVNKNVAYEQVSPYSNPEAVEKLKKYQLPADPFGLLVLYGDEPDAESTFIKREELFGDVHAGENLKFTFKGEGALVKAISFLEEGKSKAVVYFTQGNGEMSFKQAGFGGGPVQFQSSVSALVRRLGETNYDVRELALGPNVDRIPADAGLVVVARPTRPLADPAIKALRDYVTAGAEGKKGKLVVLLDAASTGDKPIKTGLEGLLAEFGVKVGDDRLMNLSPRPNEVTVVPAADSPNPNPIARAFIHRGGIVESFGFNNARAVEPQPPGPGASYTGEPILETYGSPPVWKQADLSADPAALLREYVKLAREGKSAKFEQSPIPVAVAVTEGGGPPPIPGHEFLNPGNQPRLAVFGAADWIDDQQLPHGRNYDLFASTLYWLREKPNLGVQTPDTEKTREDYTLKLPEDAETRLKFVPLGLLLTCVVALGLGVWVVRRR
jgi:hypothetical protein